MDSKNVKTEIVNVLEPQGHPNSPLQFLIDSIPEIGSSTQEKPVETAQEQSSEGAGSDQPSGGAGSEQSSGGLGSDQPSGGQQPGATSPTQPPRDTALDQRFIPSGSDQQRSVPSSPGQRSIPPGPNQRSVPPGQHPVPPSPTQRPGEKKPMSPNKRAMLNADKKCSLLGLWRAQFVGRMAQFLQQLGLSENRAHFELRATQLLTLGRMSSLPIGKLMEDLAELQVQLRDLSFILQFQDDPSQMPIFTTYTPFTPPHVIISPPVVVGPPLKVSSHPNSPVSKKKQTDSLIQRFLSRKKAKGVQGNEAEFIQRPIQPTPLVSPQPTRTVNSRQLVLTNDVLQQQASPSTMISSSSSFDALTATTCARSDAAKIDRHVQMKREKVENLDGPLEKTSFHGLKQDDPFQPKPDLLFSPRQKHPLPQQQLPIEERISGLEQYMVRSRDMRGKRVLLPLWSKWTLPTLHGGHVLFFPFVLQ